MPERRVPECTLMCHRASRALMYALSQLTLVFAAVCVPSYLLSCLPVHAVVPIEDASDPPPITLE